MRQPVILGDFIDVHEVRELFNLASNAYPLLAALQKSTGEGQDGFVFVVYQYEDRLFLLANTFSYHTPIVLLFGAMHGVEQTLDQLQQFLLQDPLPTNSELPFNVELDQLLHDLRVRVQASSMIEAAQKILRRAILYSEGLGTEHGLKLATDDFRQQFPTQYNALAAV